VAKETVMALRFIAIDPDTNSGNCPTVWADDETDDYVIKGWTVTADVLAETTPDHRETVIRVPKRMARFMREAVSGDDPAY
jgi:hypothetical protein